MRWEVISHEPYVTVNWEQNYSLFCLDKSHLTRKVNLNTNMAARRPSDSIDDLAERIGRVRRVWDEAEYLRCEAERAEEGMCREIRWLFVS